MPPNGLPAIEGSGVTRTGGRRAKTVAAPASGARRVALLAGTAAAALVVAVVVALGLLYVRLMYSPVALNFLIPSVRAGIAEELQGADVKIEAASLRLNDNGLLALELKNIRISDAEGEPLVAAPSASVSLSRRALLRGRIAAESLDLLSARLLLTYADDGSIHLRFSRANEDEAGPPPSPSLRGTSETKVDAEKPASVQPVRSDGPTLGRIDLVKVLSEASARARRREHASSYLRAVGLRSAVLILDNAGRKSIWRVPEFDLDLDHRRSRSSIAGRAKIESLTGPWEINFRSSEHVRRDAIQLDVSVQGLVPRGLARSMPELAGLERWDLPVWGDAQLELSKSGELRVGKIVLDSAPGRISIPWLAQTPLAVDGGHIEVTYNGADRRFDIGQAVFTWGDSRLQLGGSAAYAAEPGREPRWNFDIASTGGYVAAEPPAHGQLPIDQFAVRGFFEPARGTIVLSALKARMAGSEIRATGSVSDLAGEPKTRFDAQIGAMSASLFKTLWPQWAAPGVRGWASAHLKRGQVHGGVFRVIRGYGAANGTHLTTGDADQVSLTLEGSDLEFQLTDGWPALNVSRGLLRLDQNSVEFSAPDASMTGSDGRKLALKGVFAVDLQEPVPRTGKVSVRAEGPLPVALALLDEGRARALADVGVAAEAVDGKIDANLALSWKLAPGAKVSEAETQGRVRVVDGRLRDVMGSLDAQGVDLTLDLTPATADLKANFLVKGVPLRAAWQHAFNDPSHKVAPLRIVARLNDSERDQLGLDVNELVKGDVDIELTLQPAAAGERSVRMRADLKDAAVAIEGLAWKKPPGQACLFEFELAKGTTHPTELRNVRLVGDDIAVAGWMALGKDLRPKEFRFPQFSLNVVTVFEARGKLRNDNVWEIAAKGPTFDGKDLFQSFFDIEVAVDRGARNRPGLDLTAQFDTVLGFYDARLQGVKVSMQKRGGKMTDLDARGSLGSGKAFEAGVRNEPGRPRMLVARANDAGQMFRLVGFYPHAFGGDLELEVNLDGKGAAERTGALTATKFHVLGDAVTVQNVQGGDPAARKQIAREKFVFERLRAPFSVGYGQFVLHDAVVEGPLLSANMRGKLDFRTRKLYVGGTFTPLSDLNRLLRGFPVLGDIVTGPRGDGVIAVTYALKGGLENPQLEINPFSVLTPGITREFMQITPNDPNVVPPTQPGKRGRPSRKPPGAASPPGGSGNSVIDGWTSETSPTK